MKKQALLILVLVAFLGNVFVWWVLLLKAEKVLTVIFLNIGQGDSILIESPTGTQMLVDGGPNRSVLRELPKVIGPLDRSLDIVVATHADKDHIAGLVDVFAGYDVDLFLETDNRGDTSYAAALTKAGEEELGVQRVEARRGMRIHLGAGAYADVLYPDRNISGLEVNTGSIALRVVYGDHKFILTGDAPTSVEKWIVALDKGAIEGDVLKAGHHGSRTSTSAEWLDAVKPQYVVVSAGQNNSYGHPHEEVVARIQESGARMLSTQDGTVRFLSNGNELTVR